ncbi:hypothetical protein PVL29_015882 [Vitis rotundifolia]|uniref:Amine oxidase domain-containing protein n=1 Tax=Vitis rotundifolia TaxID=103349 RepID=A0AA39DJJ3_VITRO|nr:hypothetical protein PVL29_015882 [Vitis rotundifolia]
MTLTLSLPSLPCISPTPRRFSFQPRSVQLSIDSPGSFSPSERQTGVVVIGAGLAGLAAATRLHSENIPFLVLEASDAVGGRVRTDPVAGFLLDRGFQIFITAYPEAKRLLDYQALDLQKFYAGARVYYGGGFHTVADPVRHFWDSIQTLTNPIGTVLDKLLIGLARLRVLSRSDEEILAADEVPTIDFLRKFGFSESVIGRFFRPFFGGVFFDRELETTSRLFDFIFKCLALGDNTLPAKGISAIPEQLASKLPTGSVLLNSKVVSVDRSGSGTVRLQNGDTIKSELGVVVAVEEPEVAKLLGLKPAEKKPARSTVCLYFSADRNQIPVREPVLFLNGSGKGIVNNMFFATNALVSVSLIGLYEAVSDADLTAQVVGELSDWFGESIVGSWEHLRTYRVGYAQPNQSPPTNLVKDPRIGSGIYVCGDHVTSATFDGALVSGGRAVEALLRDRVKSPN